MAQIRVTIDGRAYRMACDDGQEQHLTGLAKRFDTIISGLRDSFGEIGDLRLTVMAAITVLDQLADFEQKLELSQNQREELHAARVEDMKQFVKAEQGMEQVLGDTAEKIEQMASKLNSSMHKNNESYDKLIKAEG